MVWVLLEPLNDVLGNRHEALVHVAVQLRRSFEKLDPILGSQSFTFLG